MYGGGIVGLSNSKVKFSYSTTTPTALTILGGSAGGVVGKNVRGAYTEYCWATMTVVGGGGEGPGEDIGAYVTSDTSYFYLYSVGFTQNCWTMAADGQMDFNQSIVEYPFSENS